MRVSANLDFVEATNDSAAQDWAGEKMPIAQRMEAAEFHVFYAETAPGLRAYIRRASGNEALADDILQESFLRFLRADFRQFNSTESNPAHAPLKAYLYKIATSLMVDNWRRIRRERRWSLWNFSGCEPTANPSSGDAMRFFRRLKPQEQLLLWLAYVEGFEHREIAAALGVKEKSVRVLLFRARKKLAHSLEGAGLGRRGAG